MLRGMNYEGHKVPAGLIHLGLVHLGLELLS